MSLKAFVNTKPQWDDFCEMLDEEISMYHKRLEQSNNELELYRTQGCIQALRKLKYLRDKVNGQG
jgi:ribonuclease HI